MRKLTFFLLTTLLTVALGGTANGAARTASVTGVWSDTATWGGYAVPVDGDNIVVNTGITVTVDVNTAAVTTIAINTSATANGITINGTNILNATGAITMTAPSAVVNSTIAVDAGTLNAASIAIPGSSTKDRNCIVSVSTGTINVTGAITFTGTAAQARLTFTGAGTLNLGGNLSAGGTFTASTGTVNCNGSSAQTIAGYTYYKVTVDNSAGVALVAATTISNLLTMTSGTLNMADLALTVGSLTGSGNLTHSTGGTTARTITIGSDDTSPPAYSGVISNGTNTGGVAVTKNGTGTLILSGVNSYTGLTTISAGTLKLGAAGSGANTPLGTTGARTTVSATGAALDLNGYTLATAEALTLNGTGVSSGGALMNSGSAATYSGLITLGSASSIVGGTGTIAISNAGTITGATFGLTLGGAQGGTLTSIIGTTSGTLTKADAGTWTLSGTNTYTGATTISAGTLKLGNTAALGTTAAGTSVTSDAALDLNGITLGTAEALTLNGTGVSGGGALMNSGGNATYGGLITLGSDGVSIVGGSGTIAISNVGTITGTGSFGLTLGGAAGGSVTSIIGTGATGTLTKADAGMWTLSGVNTFTGLTTVNTGTLQYGVSNALASGPVTVNNGGTLDLNNLSGTIGALTVNSGTTGGTVTTGTGTLTLGGAVTSTGAGTNALISGNLALGNNRTFAVTDAADGLTVSAVISGTSYGITKQGSGTLTLTGSNTYTGLTTVSAGTLQYGANNVLASADITVSGGTLDLSTYTESASGTLTVSNGAMLKIGGTQTLPTFTTGYSFGASSTVEYYGTTQTVSGQTYGNLTTSGSGIKTLGGDATVNGILTATTGSVLDNGINSLTVGSKTQYSLNQAYGQNWIEKPQTYDGTQFVVIEPDATSNILAWQGFFISVKKSGGVNVLFLADPAQSAPASHLEKALPDSAWYLISVPLDPGVNNDAKTYLSSPGNLNSGLLAADYTGIDGSSGDKWRIYKRIYSTGDYHNYAEGSFETLLPGRGFWIRQRYGVSKDVSITGNPVSLTDGYYKLKLDFQSGYNNTWHQIGNPYWYTIKWSDVKFSDPFDGGYERGKIVADLPPDKTETCYVRLTLVSSDGKARDTYNRAGVILTEGGNPDIFTVSELTPPDPCVKLSVTDLSNPGRRALAYDYRSAGQDVYTWNVNLATSFDRTDAELSIKEFFNVPEWMGFTLTDTKTGETFTLTGYKTIPVFLTKDTAKTFILTAARKDIPTAADAVTPKPFGIIGINPNPFNPSTTINFNLAVSGTAKVSIYNLSGQVVETLVNGQMMAGSHKAVWNASKYASGVYIVVAESSGLKQSRKITLIK